eukprot:2163128-Pleurochrysis_carterae.AAC.4
MHAHEQRHAERLYATACMGTQAHAHALLNRALLCPCSPSSSALRAFARDAFALDVFAWVSRPCGIQMPA